ncbi:MAG: hypothetical protein ACJ8J0_17140 [Longimicrobiaceae bacterium]
MKQSDPAAPGAENRDVAFPTGEEAFYAAQEMAFADLRVYFARRARRKHPPCPEGVSDKRAEPQST